MGSSTTVFPSESYLKCKDLRHGCYIFKISFLPKLGDFWIPVFGITWLFTILEPKVASSLSPSMRCLYPPSAVHKHELLNLLSPGKSWGSNQCPGSYTGACSVQTQSPKLLGAWLFTPAATQGAVSWGCFRHSTLIWIYFLAELFHHAQDKQIQPHTVTYSAPACMSVRIRLSAFLLFLTLYTGPKQDVWPAAGRYHPAIHPFHMVLSAWKLFWRLWRWRRFQEVLNADNRQEQWGLRNHREQKSWRTVDEKSQAATKRTCPSWDIFLERTEIPDCKQGSTCWGWTVPHWLYVLSGYLSNLLLVLWFLLAKHVLKACDFHIWHFPYTTASCTAIKACKAECDVIICLW